MVGEQLVLVVLGLLQRSAPVDRVHVLAIVLLFILLALDRCTPTSQTALPVRPKSKPQFAMGGAERTSGARREASLPLGEATGALRLRRRHRRWRGRLEKLGRRIKTWEDLGGHMRRVVVGKHQARHVDRRHGRRDIFTPAATVSAVVHWSTTLQGLGVERSTGVAVPAGREPDGHLAL